MKHAARGVIVSLGVLLTCAPAFAETTDEAKARIAKEHEECLATHKSDPRAEAMCDEHADAKQKSHHQKSVTETKTLFGEKLDGAALKAATDIEKQLGVPLDHTLVVAAAKYVPADKIQGEVSAKIKDAAAGLEAKVKPSVEPHAKDVADELATWAKAEKEKLKAALEKFEARVQEEADKKKWSKAEVDKRVKTEKALIERRFQQDTLRKLDAEFRKYDKGIDADINAKADEIFAAEKASWLPKVEAGLGSQLKVSMTDLASVHDRLWEHTATQRHYSKGMIRLLLRAATFRALEADVRNRANV